MQSSKPEVGNHFGSSDCDSVALHKRLALPFGAHDNKASDSTLQGQPLPTFGNNYLGVVAERRVKPLHVFGC